MSVSKKIRFEVFKRDGFMCSYCGKTPPEVTLEIDHIQPKSLKGKDDINNLITACFDCNRGKRDIPLNKAPQKLSDNLKVLKEKEKQLSEYYKFVKKIEKRVNKDVQELNDIFSSYFPKKEFSDSFKNVSVKRFLKLLSKQEIAESMHIACSKISNSSDALSYLCGICWNKIKGTNK